MHFVVTGPALTDAAVERAVRLSHEKYCSASIMLARTAEITTSFEIRS
jgi:putative redox protein